MIFLKTFEQFSNTNKESVYLRYNNIDKTTFNLICDSDPTSNQKNIGKYTEWLLKLYSFKRINISDLQDIKRYLMIADSENIDITNCKSDQDLYKLVKTFLKDEDVDTESVVINIGDDLEEIDFDFEILFDTYSFQNGNAGENYRIVLLDNKIYTAYDWIVVDMDEEEIRITDEMTDALDNIEYSEEDEYSEDEDYFESKLEYKRIEKYYNKQLKVIGKIKDKVKYFKSKYEIDNSFESEKEASKILNQNVYEARKEMLAKGYDGFVIAGREKVNYTPSSDIKYFKTEDQLENYYHFTHSLKEGKLTDSSNTIICYHRSNSLEHLENCNFDLEYSDSDALFGNAIYFASSPNITSQLGKYICKFEIKLNNSLNLNTLISEQEANRLLEIFLDKYDFEISYQSRGMDERQYEYIFDEPVQYGEFFETLEEIIKFGDVSPNSKFKDFIQTILGYDSFYHFCDYGTNFITSKGDYGYCYGIYDTDLIEFVDGPF